MAGVAYSQPHVHLAGMQCSIDHIGSVAGNFNSLKKVKPLTPSLAHICYLLSPVTSFTLLAFPGQPPAHALVLKSSAGAAVCTDMWQLAVGLLRRGGAAVEGTETHAGAAWGDCGDA